MNQRELDGAVCSAVKEFLATKDIEATLCHSSSGDRILRLPGDKSLMILAELYDDNTGDHKTIQLGNPLVAAIEEWS